MEATELCWIVLSSAFTIAHTQTYQIGREVAISEHLQNGQEFQVSLTTLLEFGRQLFTANWTIQEGQGVGLRMAWTRPRLSPTSLGRDEAVSWLTLASMRSLECTTM